MLKKQVLKIAKIVAILAIIAGGGFVSIKGIYSALEWETHLLPIGSGESIVGGGVGGVFRAGDRTVNGEDRYYGLAVSPAAIPLYYDSTSWRVINGGRPNMDFRAVWAQDYQNFWVAGQGQGASGESLYHYDVNSGVWTEKTDLIYDFSDFNDVAGAVNTNSGKTALFVVGKNTLGNGLILYKTDFSGFDFSSPIPYSIPGVQVNSVSAVFDNVNNKYLAWAVTKNGKVYDYDSSRPGIENEKWASNDVPISELRGVTAVRDKDGVINVWVAGGPVGQTNKIFKKQVDGSFIEPAEYSTSDNKPLNSISGVYDANKNLFKVWAVGNLGSNNLDLATIIHYDGSSWKMQNQGSPTGFSIKDVVAINPDHVWAFGRSGSGKAILTLSPGNVGGWAWLGANNRDCSNCSGDDPFGWISLNCADKGLCLQKEFNYGVNIDEGAIASGLAPLEGYAWVGGSDQSQVDGVVEDGNDASDWGGGGCSAVADGGAIKFNSGTCGKSNLNDSVHRQLNFKIEILNAGQPWKFSVIAETQNGEKEISYSSSYQSGAVINGKVYSLGVGQHSITRDLEADLHKEEPNNSITRVTGVKAEVAGAPPEPFLMDDIKLEPGPATSWLSFNRSAVPPAGGTGNPPTNPYQSGSGAIAKYEPAIGKLSGWARFLGLKKEGENQNPTENDWGWVKLRGNSGSIPPDPPPPYNTGNNYVFSGCYGIRVDSNNNPLPLNCENETQKKCDDGNSCTEDSDCGPGGKCGSSCDFKICKGTKDPGTNYSCNQCGDWANGLDGDGIGSCNDETGICTTCSSCDLYGVSVDGRTGRVSGYAWSEKPSRGFGWLDFSQAYYRGKLWLKTEWSDIYSETRIGSGRVVAPPAGSYNATYMLQCGETNPANECTITNFTSWAAEQMVGSLPTDWIRARESTMKDVKFPDELSSYTSTIGKIDYIGLTTVVRTEAGKDYNKYGQEVTEFSGDKNFQNLIPSGKLGGGVYHIKDPDGALTGNLTIDSPHTIKNGSVAGESGAGLIVVDGDVIVENSGQLKYEVGSIDSLKELASLGFFIKGNLIINERVAELVGAYYVGAKVTVEGNASRPDQDPQFVNYGPMVAREFRFSRQFRGGISEVEPAEKIIYDGRVVANPPPGFDDLSKNLPVVREVMP